MESLSLFDYNDYKEFIRAHLKTLPREGYGQFTRLAEHLGVNAVSISQIFGGDRELSEEHALEVAEFFGLNEKKTDYFLQLVRLKRAGSHKLKEKIRLQIRFVQEQQLDVGSRVKQDLTLASKAQEIFYSTWKYSAVRLSTSLRSVNSEYEISTTLGIPPAEVNKIMGFLLDQKLVVRKKGVLSLGPSVTHVGALSPHVVKHHLNWRAKALESLGNRDGEEMSYTAPMSVKLEVLVKLKKELLSMIEKLNMEAKGSAPNQMACLTIDLFKI